MTTTTTTGSAAFTLTTWEVHHAGVEGLTPPQVFLCHSEGEAVALSSKLGHHRCHIKKVAITFA